MFSMALRNFGKIIKKININLEGKKEILWYNRFVVRTNTVKEMI